MSYTLAEMEKVTGASRRAIQFWTDRGVLKPEGKQTGKGIHRAFSPQEAFLACIIKALADNKMTVSELKAIADRVRKNILGQWWGFDWLERLKKEELFLIMQPKKNHWELVWRWQDKHETSLSVIVEGPRGMFIHVNKYAAGLRHD
jgi:DNA-binding transcriptional MerR regulator